MTSTVAATLKTSDKRLIFAELCGEIRLGQAFSLPLFNQERDLCAEPQEEHAARLWANVEAMQPLWWQLCKTCRY